MKFFRVTLYTQLKRIATPFYLICALLLPLFLILLGSYFGRGQSLSVSLGVYYEDNATAKAIINWVDQNSLLPFTRYEDLEQLKLDVLTEKIQAGFELSPEIIQGKSEKAIIVYENPNTMPGNLYGESLGAALIQAESGKAGVSVLSQYFPGADPDLLAKEILKRAQAYTKDGLLMKINVVSERYGASVQAENPLRQIVHGVMALVLLFLVLFQASTQFDDKNNLILRRLSSFGNQLNTFSLGSLFSMLILALCSGALCLLVLQSLFDNGLYAIWREVISLFCYLFFICSFAQLLSQIIKDKSTYVTLVILYFLLNTLFGSGFFSLQQFLPIVWILQFAFPLFYYQTSVSSSLNITSIVFSVLLLVVGVAIFFIALRIQKNKNK